MNETVEPEFSTRPLTAVIEARQRGDVDALIAALSDTDQNVRRVSANGLLSLGSPKAIEPLLRLARDSADEVLRLLAIKAIGAAGGGGQEPELVAIALGPNSLDVRVTAIAVLVDLGDPRSVALLAGLIDSDELSGRPPRVPHARSSLRWALDRLVEVKGVEAIPSIERGLRRLDFRDRRYARRALRRLQKGAS